jgi:hypothetical protein
MTTKLTREDLVVPRPTVHRLSDDCNGAVTNVKIKYQKSITNTWRCPWRLQDHGKVLRASANLCLSTWMDSNIDAPESPYSRSSNI